MTMNDLQRAYLAIFAAREAGPRASADQMKAIAICIRNRVREGWHDGDWMRVIDSAWQTRANPPLLLNMVLDPNDRNFQILARDIDEIYFSRRDWEKDPSYAGMPELDEAVGKATYWAFINQPYTAWFSENILKHPQQHPPKTQMGVMMFYA